MSRARVLLALAAALAAAAPARPAETPRAARVAVLSRDGARPRALDVLARAGIPCRAVSPEALADPAALSRADTDLVVIPCSPWFPAAAAENFKAFLKAGGAFFACGGYAFDAPDPPSAGLRLNARHGDAHDAVGFPEDVLGVFDPSYLVERSARIVAARGAQRLLPPGADFAPETASAPYFAAVALTGSGNPVFPEPRARWVPVLEARDRFGRPRGPVLALLFNHAGPYAGSAWAFSAHPDLFARPDDAADRLFADVCRRLLAPGALASFTAEPVSVRAGEPVALRAVSAGLPAGAVCRFSANGRALAEVPFADGVASWTCAPDAADAAPDGLVTFAAEAVADGRAVDAAEAGAALRLPPAGPAFAFRDNAASLDGRPRFFGGANTTGRTWFAAGEDPLAWSRDFAAMRDFGMKFMRFLHFSPFARAAHPEREDHATAKLAAPPPERTRRQTDALVQLAARNGVCVFLSLHDWIPWELEADGLADEARWNAFWADRYRAWPNVFYDIQNEPAFDRLPSAGRGRDWTDLAARDGERRRAALFHRWQRANAEAVHAACPSAAVTTGNLQTLDAVDKQLSTDGIDFSDVHHYGDAANLRGVVKLTDRRFEGRGLSLGEFGSAVAHDARGRGETGDPAALSIRHFLHVNHYVYAMGGAFTGVWDWREFPDAVFPWGVNRQDLVPKDVLPAYRNMTLMFGAAGPLAERPALYFVLPDAFRLGGRTDQIHEALRRAADALLALGVPFGVINEEGLAALPPEARALVWPLAVCPSDAAFDAVARFARGGGRVLVTGDFRHDPDRRPTRAGRAAALGLAADFPPLDPFATPGSEADFPTRTAGGVTWSPAAVELTFDDTRVRACYRAFLDAAPALPRLRVDPADEGGLIRFRAPLAGGGASETAVNGLDRAVSFGAVALAPFSTYWRWTGADGALRACALAGEAPGLKVEGAPCAFVSLDGLDLAVSRRILALPFGASRATLARAPGAPALKGERGEFRGGRWRTLEAADPEAAENALRAETPADCPCDMMVLYAPSERAAAVAAAEELL